MNAARLLAALIFALTPVASLAQTSGQTGGQTFVCPRTLATQPVAPDGWAPEGMEGPRIPLVNAVLLRGGVAFLCTYGPQDKPAIAALARNQTARNCVANAPANWSGDSIILRCTAAAGVDCSARCTN